MKLIHNCDSFIYAMYRILLNEIQVLGETDGHDSWRVAEHRALSDLVQKRFRYLQNPPDCSKARKLVVHLNKVRSLAHHIISTSKFKNLNKF